MCFVTLSDCFVTVEVSNSFTIVTLRCVKCDRLMVKIISLLSRKRLFLSFTAAEK